MISLPFSHVCHLNLLRLLKKILKKLHLTLDSGYYQDENIKIDHLLFIIFQVLFTKIRSNNSPSDIQLGRNELTKTININQVIATKDVQFQILYFLPSKRLL
jgi:hypothetical protein